MLELAGSGIFRARWTDMIHDEWIGNLLEKRPDLRPSQLARTRRMMNAAVMGCLVEGFEDLIPNLALPDKDDRHVLAAAIQCGADAIVTFNTKDFPRDVAARYGLEILHPDDFLHQQFDLDTAAVVVAASNCRSRLRSPPKTATDYLQTLEAQGLPLLVAELRAFESLI
jgi:hypothetical protein